MDTALPAWNQADFSSVGLGGAWGEGGREGQPGQFSGGWVLAGRVGWRCAYPTYGFCDCCAAPCALRGGGLAVAGLAGRCGGAVSRGRGGEFAGLPEEEDCFEAGEDAGQDGGDEGVQGFGQHSPVRPRGRFAQVGDRVAEGGRVLGHVGFITNGFRRSKRFSCHGGDFFGAGGRARCW